jgi:hypothetical protein
MVSKEAVQAFLKEIQGVCLKHNLFLRGVCREEGLYGEILIQDPEGMTQCGWRSEGSNQLVPDGEPDKDSFGAWYVDGVKGAEIVPFAVGGLPRKGMLEEKIK